MGTFKVYIFRQDMATLKRLSSSSSPSQGSLFGLWTSTGNPVIHVVLPSTALVSEQKAREDLKARYQMSYLGKWRSTGTGEAHFDRIAREISASSGHRRFLAVILAAYSMVRPYLFVAGQAQVGTIDMLEGTNPYVDDPDTKSILEGRYYRAAYQPQRTYTPEDSMQYSPTYTSAAVCTWPTAYTAQTSSVEAQTDIHQWYAGEQGQEKLRYVYETLQQFADRHEVHMNRDKTTQDLSMTLLVNNRQWKIDFSARFPMTGAKMAAVAAGGGSTSYNRRTAQIEVQRHTIKTAIGEITEVLRQYR